MPDLGKSITVGMPYMGWFEATGLGHTPKVDIYVLELEDTTEIIVQPFQMTVKKVKGERIICGLRNVSSSTSLLIGIAGC